MMNRNTGIISRNILRAAERGLWPFWSDEQYLKALWKFRNETDLNLNNP